MASYLYTLAVDAPHATAYDEEFPTRSNENYSHALHEILQGMEDAGPWYIFSEYTSGDDATQIRSWIRSTIQVVFNYAKSAIVNYRAGNPPGLAEPAYTMLPSMTFRGRKEFDRAWLRLEAECMKMMYKIYYLWETEEDPLRIKDYIRDMLIAWPLQDVEISLQEEGGQKLRVYPVWKDIDI
jgi:hypothetical protein